MTRPNDNFIQRRVAALHFAIDEITRLSTYSQITLVQAMSIYIVKMDLDNSFIKILKEIITSDAGEIKNINDDVIDIRRNNCTLYIIPGWAVSAIINGDCIRLSKEEMQQIINFNDSVLICHGIGYWCQQSKNTKSYFSKINDVDTMAGDVERWYYISLDLRFTNISITRSVGDE